MEEKIVACAFKDTKDGKVYLSRMCHAEILGIFYRMQDKEIGHRCEQGFITSLDRFVDRKEALKIAQNAKQEIHKWCDTDELYSEDIFWNPFEEGKFKEQEKIIDLMLIDLSNDAFYMDDNEQYCEVKHKECDGKENVPCKKCLLEYYKKKAREKNDDNN